MKARVDQYLLNGCMRCKYGGTPQCKVHLWTTELQLLRRILLQTELTEEIKWGVPVYTYQGKNVVTISALKGAATIGFFKGVLLKDPHHILSQQGNIQSARMIRFTQANDILQKESVLKAYIQEAIALEASGQKVILTKNPEPLPPELLEAFENDPAFRKAFFALTPGRQRGYIIHFSQPRQSQTRLGRIEKYKAQIMNGEGLHDGYRSQA